MEVTPTEIEGLFILTPKVWGDHRGYFYEAYNKSVLAKAGITNQFIQDNQAKSTYGVLRGLHYQVGQYAQAKLVRVIEGAVLDVVVDLRSDSKTYGHSFSIELSAENKKQLFIPRGFAHGYVVLSPVAEFFYKCDNVYHKESEGGIIYNDPHLKIDWLIDTKQAKLSEKDLKLPTFGNHRT